MAFNLEEYARKHSAHPETVAFLKTRVGDAATPYQELDVETARRFRIKRSEVLSGRVELQGSEWEIIIPSTTNKGNPH